MAMAQVPLGRTGVEVSRVVLGCGNIGGIGSPAETRGKGNSREEGYELITRAVDLGITVLDTANTYADGVSEEVVGQWVTDHPGADVLVETKVGNIAELGQTDVDLTTGHITRQVHASTGRLGRIDLYLSHAPDDTTPIEETLEAFEALREQGAIRAYGGSNLSADQLRAAVAAAERLGIPGYGWVQNEYSMLARADEAEVLPILADHGMGFTPFSPLAGGLLTGKYRLGAEPPLGSRMAAMPWMAPALDEPTAAAIERLAREAERRGVSSAALALAWVLAAPGITAPIVAPRDAGQFASVEEALALELDEDEWRSVGALLDRG